MLALAVTIVAPCPSQAVRFMPIVHLNVVRECSQEALWSAFHQTFIVKQWHQKQGARPSLGLQKR